MRSRRSSQLVALLVLVILCVLPSVLGLGELVGEPPANDSRSPNREIIDWTGAIDKQKTAYLTFLPEVGKYDDEAYFQGVQTLVKSLQLTGTERDIVVLVTAQTRASSREWLGNAGVIVMDAPDMWTEVLSAHKRLQDAGKRGRDGKAFPLPSRDDPLCPRHLYRVLAWSLVNYERVIYLDPDVVVLHNMDELFLCGEYCQVFLNFQWNVFSLLVLKPSRKVFNELMERFVISNVPHEAAVHGCSNVVAPFMFSYFTRLEHSPHFDPTHGQQHVPQMRLSPNYNLNTIFYYEYFSWHLFKLPQYDGERIPGFSVSFPTAKPFRWLTAFFFNMTWWWRSWHAYFVPFESYTGFIVTSTLALVALVLFGHIAVPRASNFLLSRWPNLQPSLSAAILKMCQKVPKGPTLFQFGVTVVLLTTSVYLTITSIPPHSPPHLAIPVAICLNSILFYVGASIFSCVCFMDSAGGIPGAKSPKLSPREMKAMAGADPEEAGGLLDPENDWKLAGGNAEAVRAAPTESTGWRSRVCSWWRALGKGGDLFPSSRTSLLSVTDILLPLCALMWTFLSMLWQGHFQFGEKMAVLFAFVSVSLYLYFRVVRKVVDKSGVGVALRCDASS